MISDDVAVRPSAIHGLGVFALRDVKAGEIVLRWDVSHTLDEQTFRTLPEADKHYVAKIGDRYVAMQSPERYLNHSCEPNTSVSDFCDMAIRDIRAGEELTGNYIEDLPEGLRFACMCGSRTCATIITRSG